MWNKIILAIFINYVSFSSVASLCVTISTICFSVNLLTSFFSIHPVMYFALTPLEHGIFFINERSLSFLTSISVFHWSISKFILQRQFQELEITILGILCYCVLQSLFAFSYRESALSHVAE